jgi:hypothetical protein
MSTLLRHQTSCSFGESQIPIRDSLLTDRVAIAFLARLGGLKEGLLSGKDGRDHPQARTIVRIGLPGIHPARPSP